jgi:hypothetical protein
MARRTPHRDERRSDQASRLAHRPIAHQPAVLHTSVGGRRCGLDGRYVAGTRDALYGVAGMSQPGQPDRLDAFEFVVERPPWRRGALARLAVEGDAKAHAWCARALG